MGSQAYINYFLGMSVIMEMLAILVFESIGLTLQKRVTPPTGSLQQDGSSKPRNAESIPLQQRHNVSAV